MDKGNLYLVVDDDGVNSELKKCVDTHRKVVYKKELPFFDIIALDPPAKFVYKVYFALA